VKEGLKALLDFLLGSTTTVVFGRIRTMTFKPTDFSGWCEQDVREGIIAKLLERLGYEKGTQNDILRGGWPLLILQY
jgi:hypothetical protein